MAVVGVSMVVAVEASMVGGAAAFMAATAEAASAVVTEGIEAATVAGDLDMDGVVGDMDGVGEAVGDMDLGSA